MEQQAPPSRAAIELMGVSAYTHLTTFIRHAAAADFTPPFPLKLTLASMAVAEFDRYRSLERAADGYGLEIAEAIAPFAPVIDEYHRRTTARDWTEAALKAYVGDGLIVDLHRMLAQRVEPVIGDLIVSTLSNNQEEHVFLRALQETLVEHPQRVGQLTLYARKLLGETMTRARTALRRAQALADVTGDGGDPLGQSTVVLARLGRAHEERMSVLGLAT